MIALARPDWDRLFETAAGQAGHFTTRQSAEAGYSPQLLGHHVRAGRITRVRRGIYRLVHFPAEQNEELVVAWLWSERAGVISHQTALSLHGLSDALPARAHLSIPSTWRRRRFRAPPDVVLHHADVPPRDRTWFGAIPITTPRRSLNDCARDGLSPELLRAAARQALRRGLVTQPELARLRAATRSGAGLSRKQTFAFRKTHPLPAKVPDPLPAWTQPYAAMAREDQLAWPTLADGRGERGAGVPRSNPRRGHGRNLGSR